MLLELLWPTLLFDADDGGGTGGLAAAEDGSTPPAGDGGPGPGTGNDDEGDLGFSAPFSMEEVPQEARPYVEQFVKQTRDAFLAKANELAEQRKAIEEAGATQAEAVKLVERLNDPEQVVDAMNELAERYDLVPAGGQVEPSEPPDPNAELANKVESIEQRLEREDQERVDAARRKHVYDGIDSYKESIGVKELPERVVKQLIAGSLAREPLDNGMPDIAGAIRDWKEAVEAEAEARKAEYLDSKDTDPPDLAGGTGIEEIDASTSQGRRRKAEAIAERAMASHSAHA